MAYILSLNGGSSSIKFALFENDAALKPVLTGKIDHIGSANTAIEAIDHRSEKTEQQSIAATDQAAVIAPLAKFLEKRVSFDQIEAVGHRIVHGGSRYSEPEVITAELLAYLETISPYDPEHLPAELAMIRTISADYPKLRQIACFDTAFHHNMPPVARILPIPRRFYKAGVQRYGFHGLSYAFLMAELKRLAGDANVPERVILAHLGSGASMAAVHSGQSIDTTMSFTPTAGLVMSSRTGDLDPGLASFLAHTEKMTAEQFSHMANFESGLLGVSETSADMHELLKHEKDDSRAAEAVALFCYSAKKFIGAYTAALGGLDALVFSGGIGENAAVIRARICDGLEFLGIRLDTERNEANAPIISAEASPVTVRVIKTDEERQMARFVQSKLEKERT